MPGRKSRKISCKFCGEKANFMKLYNDYFCSQCLRFQQESNVSEVSLLPIFKLRKYTITAQKYAYFIYNELGHKIASCERRDLSKIVGKKGSDIRYVFFNDINRIIGSIDAQSTNEIKEADASWVIYDYGRNQLATLTHYNESDNWDFVDPAGNVFAKRELAESSVTSKTARKFTVVNASNPEEILFGLNRKAGFEITILAADFNAILAWSTVIGLHRRYYL